MMRAILASVLLLGLTGTAHAADCAPLQIENSVKMVPRHPNRILLPITLNGIEKRFLFDTGGGLSAISQSTVKELKLPEFRSNYRSSDLYGHDSESFVQVHEVILGTAKNNGVQFQLMADFGAPNEPGHFDGVIASGIFLHDDIDLDFGAERVNFFSTDHCEGKVVYWPHQVLSVIPITKNHGHLEVPVMLDGHTLRALLDTGASVTTMDLARAKRVLNFSPDAPSSGNAPKDNPEKQLFPRRFATLPFDGVTVQNPLVYIQPLQFGGGKNDQMALGSRAEHQDDDLNRLNPDLTIGMDILRHLHVYFASRESKLYVTEAGQGESVLFKTPAAPEK